ncbi:MAG: GGDEF domain-containing protein, partial [Gammaproteobacteria bacterium]
MNSLLDIEHIPGRPGGRFEPYVRLVHCLVPRTMYVAMFGPAGDLMWSTEPVSGPDLMNVVDDALLSARSNPDSPGQVRLLPGNLPVYLCSLRDDTKRLLVVLAVVCRATEVRDRKSPDFAFAYTLLSPMLECLRRELVTRATIDELNHTVGGLDRGMNLLLAYGGAEQSAAPADGANELQALLQQTIEHLRARTGALLVPERNVTLVRAGQHAPTDTQFLMRAHRRLLSLAQAQREPVVINETLSAATPDALAYRVLCCSLRSRAGRFIGVLALLREAGAEAFTERDAHIAEILARKAIGVIESSYDALSGLYTRTAFERRVRAVIADHKASQAWSALYIDVDQLHVINEKAGMHVGDAVLAQLGELLRQRLPPGAFGSRISGDRFVVLVPAEMRD